MPEDTDSSPAPETHDASTIGGNVKSVFSSAGVYLVAAGALGVLVWWFRRKRHASPDGEGGLDEVENGDS